MTTPPDNSYRVLATDYDETLAIDGYVSEPALDCLKKFKQAQGKLVLVTGRRLPELQTVFPDLGLFDRVVVENGGTLFDPITRSEDLLATPPSAELIAALQKRSIPLAIGRVILASKEPHEKTIVEVIKDLGLEHHIIFNKGSIMILPSGINKATGLNAALNQLGLQIEKTIGIGDGENDHAFLEKCGYSVAVQNAVPSLKEKANWITPGASSIGFCELVDRLLTADATV